MPQDLMWRRILKSFWISEWTKQGPNFLRKRKNLVPVRPQSRCGRGSVPSSTRPWRWRSMTTRMYLNAFVSRGWWRHRRGSGTRTPPLPSLAAAGTPACLCTPGTTYTRQQSTPRDTSAEGGASGVIGDSHAAAASSPRLMRSSTTSTRGRRAGPFLLSRWHSWSWRRTTSDGIYICRNRTTSYLFIYLADKCW